MGDPSIERWGVEPEGGVWTSVIPASSILVYGSPLDDPMFLEGDESIGGGFDWAASPWYEDPWNADLNDTAYLLVGSCAVPSQTALISHVRKDDQNENLEALLPRGSGPSYCFYEDPLLAAGFLERAVRLASAVIPLWPQPLSAALAVGVSGSGKAREFSPFYGYDTSPDASVTVSEPYGGPSPVGETICFNPPDCSPFTAGWTTAGGSPLATWETVVIYTKDNNGATVDFGEIKPPEGGWAGWAECANDGRNRIRCECDAREGIQNCAGIQLGDLTLNKPGVYQICVEGLYNDYGSGLNIYRCTGEFHISPN
jgi:hypothetical protein